MFAVKVKRVDEQRVRHEKPVKHVVRVLRQVVSIKNSLQSLADNRFNRMTLKVLLHILRLFIKNVPQETGNVIFY